MKAKINAVIIDSFYIGLIVIIIFVIMELGARVYLNKYKPSILDQKKKMIAYSYFDWSDKYFRDAMKQTDTGNDFLYEPYSLWKNTNKKTETINIENGYRVTWTPEQNQNENDYLILIFGGSTAFCIEVPDEFTIPSLISKKLNAHNRQYRYIVKNYSAPGFSNENEIHLLVDLLRRGERPKAVIFYDGTNDILNKVARGIPHWQYRLFESIGTRYTVKQSVKQILSRFQLPSLFRHNKESFIQDQSTLKTNTLSMLQNYSNNVEFVNKLGTVYNFKTFFFWQSDIFSTKKRLTDEENLIKTRHADLEPALKITAAAMIDKDFLKKNEIYDIRDSLDSIEESIFIDPFHITSIGNMAVAKSISLIISKKIFTMPNCAGIAIAYSAHAKGLEKLNSVSSTRPKKLQEYR